MVIIYTGDGKGKTTAAAGSAIRMAGNGRGVLFAQFLKDGTSGECAVLGQIPCVELMLPEKSFGFTFCMDEKTKEEAKEFYTEYLKRIIKASETGKYAMVVLDEAIGAIGTNMIEEAEVLGYLRENRDSMEIILTGREPSALLLEQGDYITDMKKVRHPYDKGIGAREGIEK